LCAVNVGLQENFAKNYIKCVEKAYFVVENAQKSINNWERFPY